MAVLAVFAAVFLFTAGHGTAFATTTALNFGLFTLLAASLQLMLGFSNQASLTQAGIYGVGAYAAVYAETKAGVPLPVALLASLAAGAVLGLLIALPLSRLREHFLALGTLAAQVILSSVFIHLSGLTGGVNGEAVPDFVINSVPVLGVIFLCAALIVAGLNHLRVSRVGRRPRRAQRRGRPPVSGGPRRAGVARASRAVGARRADRGHAALRLPQARRTGPRAGHRAQAGVNDAAAMVKSRF